MRKAHSLGMPLVPFTGFDGAGLVSHALSFDRPFQPSASIRPFDPTTQCPLFVALSFDIRSHALTMTVLQDTMSTKLDVCGWVHGEPSDVPNSLGTGLGFRSSSHQNSTWTRWTAGWRASQDRARCRRWRPDWWTWVPTSRIRCFEVNTGPSRCTNPTLMRF